MLVCFLLLCTGLPTQTAYVLRSMWCIWPSCLVCLNFDPTWLLQPRPQVLTVSESDSPQNATPTDGRQTANVGTKTEKHKWARAGNCSAAKWAAQFPDDRERGTHVVQVVRLYCEVGEIACNRPHLHSKLSSPASYTGTQTRKHFRSMINHEFSQEPLESTKSTSKRSCQIKCKHRRHIPFFGVIRVAYPNSLCWMSNPL